MARAALASAPRTSHASHASHASQTPPANDAPAAPASRTHALTDAHRTRCLAEARAVPATALGNRFLPTHLDARFDWMDATLNAAWRDRDELARVALDGTALTEEAIDAVGVAVLYARECVLQARVVVPMVAVTGDVERAPVAKLSEVQLADEGARAAQVVGDALAARLTVGGVSEEEARVLRPLLRRVRAAKGARGRRLAVEALVAYCAEGDCERWLRAQCLGEGAALDRLREVHRESARRMRSGAVEPKSTRYELAVRAVAVALQGVKRVVVVGRYLTHRDVERRGDYAGFREPRARRTTKASKGDPT